MPGACEAVELQPAGRVREQGIQLGHLVGLRQVGVLRAEEPEQGARASTTTATGCDDQLSRRHQPRYRADLVAEQPAHTASRGGITRTTNYNRRGLLTFETLAIDGDPYEIDYAYNTRGQLRHADVSGRDSDRLRAECVGRADQGRHVRKRHHLLAERRRQDLQLRQRHRARDEPEHAAVAAERHRRVGHQHRLRLRRRRQCHGDHRSPRRRTPTRSR